MYLLVLLFILLTPFIGLLLITLNPYDYFWLTSGGSVFYPLLYYSFFLLGSFVAAVQLKRQSIAEIPGDLKSLRSENLLFFLLFLIVLLLLTFYDGLNVFLGSSTKEDIRQSGFLHAFLVKYLAPSIFAFISIKYRMRQISATRFWFSLIMTFLVGLSTGGKASALIVVLPGVAIVFQDRFTLLKFLILALFTFLSLVITAWLFDSFLGGDISLIAEYLMHRTFALTAESPFHISLAYANNQSLIDYSYTLLEIFGKSILPYFGFTQDPHKYIFSFAITAWIYPNELDSIVSGSWNITPNAFVEALIIGGWVLLPIFGWIIVYFGLFLWNHSIKLISDGKYANGAITSVYAVLVYLSWINSAGIMQLIHPLAIGSLLSSWLIIKVLSTTAYQFKKN
jgi:hypothetical protein